MSARIPRFAIGPVVRIHTGLALAVIAASWLLVSRDFALATAIGVLFETVNFRTLFRASETVLGTGEKDGVAGAAAGAMLGFGLRFVLLAGAVGAALWSGLHPVGLVLGLSLIVPATVIGAWQVRPRPDPTAEALPPDDPIWERWDAWRATERDEDELAEEDE